MCATESISFFPILLLDSSVSSFKTIIFNFFMKKYHIYIYSIKRLYWNQANEYELSLNVQSSAGWVAFND